MRTAFAIAGHTPPWPALGAAENPIPMTLRFLFALVPLLAARLLAQSVPAPAVLHSTYLGGSGPDYVTDGGQAIATGPGGTLYVLGQTSSASFPTTAVIGVQTNGYGTFIARFSPDGRTRLQTTFIGGIAARALAVDSTGSVYLTGEPGGSLPGESSAQANFGGAFDAFVVKLNPAGTEVVYATYLGGSDLEIGRSLAVDNTGVAYVAGWTSSTNFPATPGAAQTTIGGNYDAFVAARYPGFPARRAFFVETDTTLSVFAAWQDRIAEDLRHETTHGYVHAVVPAVPLWLDEGIAEFFETPRTERGLHRGHAAHLAGRMLEGTWRPGEPCRYLGSGDAVMVPLQRWVAVPPPGLPASRCGWPTGPRSPWPAGNGRPGRCAPP
jgi:hypothetical protein